MSSENSLEIKNKNSDFQFLIDSYELLDQQKAIELWNEKVGKSPHTLSAFFPNQNSNTYYQQIRKIQRGIKLKTKSSIFDHFKNLCEVSAKKNLDFTIDDLKSCISKSIPSTKSIIEPRKIKSSEKPQIVQVIKDQDTININEKNYNQVYENLITFEEIWDEIGDLSFGHELLDKMEKQLNQSVIKNSSKDIQPFLRDDIGEPRLEYTKHNNRVFQTEFDTDEINDPTSVELIAEISNIFDMRADLQTNINGKISSLSFQTSQDRIKKKFRGFNIFNELKRRGIKISLFHGILTNTAFKTDIIEIPKPNLPNILTLKTNINIQTVFVIIFGNKNYLVPEEQNRNFRQYIDDHSKKMVNLIESRIYVGRPVK